MNVGELKKYLGDIPDDYEIMIQSNIFLSSQCEMGNYLVDLFIGLSHEERRVLLSGFEQKPHK